MENLSKTELLNFAIENGMISIDTIQKQIEMNERKKYLEMHESKVWQSTDGKWYTFLPDYTKEKGRRLVKRGNRESIEDCIVEHYKKSEKEVTVDFVFEAWINKKLDYEEISKQTVDRYRTDYNRFFKPEFRKRKIEYIDEDCLEKFILCSIKENNLKAKGWSNLRTIIRGMFLYAKKKGYTKLNIVNFMAEIELSKRMFNHEKKPDNKSVFTEKEIKRILEYIGTSTKLNDLAILFAIYTGMRVGEIVSLKWEDISEDTVYVNRTQIRYKDENKKVVHEVRNFPKTEAGIRSIVIVPELKKVISKLRTKTAFCEYAFDRKGTPVPKHSVCTRLYFICDKLGIERKGMHAIRKYYATKLINAGVEEIIIINQMGHTDFNTTKSYYYKNNQEKEYIYERISKAINS